MLPDPNLLPPDIELIPFISIGIAGKNQDVVFEDVVNPIQAFSLNLADRAVYKAQSIIKPEISNKKLNNKGLFVLHKLKKLIKKRKDIKAKFLLSKIDVMTKLIDWISVCCKNRLIVKFDVNGYDNFINVSLGKNEELLEINSRIYALKYYIEASDFVIPETDVADCKQPMEESEHLADTKLGFCPECSFDSVFLKFVDYHGMGMRFDSFAEQMLKKKIVTVTIEDLNQLSTSFLILLKPTNKAQQTVVKSTINRICYQYIFFHDVSIFTTNDTIEFLKKCVSFSKKTPNAMEIGRYFPEELRDKEFCKIVESNEQLKEISNTIESIQYMVHPADIAFIVHDTLTKIQHIKGITNLKEREMMCFDDVLSFFTPVFATAPPVNALRISKFLNNCQFPSTSSLDFGRMIFISATSYIEES